MTVTETLQGLGKWDVSFHNVPKDTLNKIQYFGHIAVHPGHIDYRMEGDAALLSARYVGVITEKDAQQDTLEISGAGMASWLGDSDQKGSVIETPVTFTAQTFANTVRALLPSSGAITEGTLFNLVQTFTGSFVFQSPREAIDYVCETVGAEWRVKGNGTLDAGLVTDLFVTNPRALVSRRLQGVDMSLRSFLGQGKSSQDVQDFSTRVVLLAMGQEASTVTATADINPVLNPFKDIHGNTVKLTRLISESTTDPTNAPARAQLQMNRFSGATNALSLSTKDYDVKGTVVVGDYVWVYDEEIGLSDPTNEVLFQGVRCNPMKLRLTEITFPISSHMSVGYRDPNGVWYNLTDYVDAESGDTQFTVGDFQKSLSGADGGIVGSRPQPDTSIPGQPTWVTPFTQSIYQNLRGDTRAQAQLTWTRPNNEDGSSISDGDHYEIRYRQASTPLFPVTWSQVATKTWSQLGTWDNPIQYVVGEWNYLYVPWEQLSFLIIDLLPNMPYEAQIRAVDGATPANAGDWSALTSWQSNGDIIPPSQPAPPTVFASRIAVQVVHELGTVAGGTFNLDLDLHHLEIHGEYEPNFTPTDATLLGKIIANAGMITGHIPAIGTVPIESVAPVYFKVIAVDNDGNQSLPSPAVQQTAELIDDAHISNLTVSKVTAGTITSDWILGASIKTGLTGARAELDANGIRLYDTTNAQTANFDATTGNVTLVGKISTKGTGQRIEIDPLPTSGVARLNWYNDPAVTTDRISAYFLPGFGLALENQDSSFTTKGGKTQLSGTFGIFGFKNATHDNYLWFHDDGNVQLKVDGQVDIQSGNGAAELIMGADNYIQLKGRWLPTAMGGQSAVVVGWNDSVGGGPLNAGWGYGATLADNSSPIPAVYYTSDVATMVTYSPNTSGFDSHSNMPGTWGLHWWVYRSA